MLPEWGSATSRHVFVPYKVAPRVADNSCKSGFGVVWVLFICFLSPILQNLLMLVLLCCLNLSFYAFPAGKILSMS